MNHAKAMIRLAARWLVVALASVVVLHGNALAFRAIPSVNLCAPSCDRTCPCCLSKSAPSETPAPLAPASQTRSGGEKNFQFAPLLAALLAPVREPSATILAHNYLASFPSQAPLYQRHCAYLI